MLKALSRRSLLAVSAAVLLGLPVAGALAAPFASGRITVRTEGSGPDVILIPGLSSSPRVWDTTVAALPGYRYHLVQVAGFAGQAVGANTEGAVAAPVAEEVARYIKEAGLTRPAVVGHSMGGTIGLMLAARHPDSLSRLMVVDMMPFLGAMMGGPDMTPEKVKPFADQMAARMRAGKPEDKPRIAAMQINAMVSTESMRPIAIDDFLKTDNEVSIRAYQELLLTDLRPELPGITVPTTVLYTYPKGAPVGPAQIDMMYKAVYAPLKQATLVPVPDSAHFIMWDQPARFQGALKAFLDAK